MAEVYDYNELVASQRISAANDNDIMVHQPHPALIKGKYVAMKPNVELATEVAPASPGPVEIGVATELSQETPVSFGEISPLGESAPDLSATQVFDTQSLVQEAPVMEQAPMEIAPVESAPALSPIGEQPIFEPIAPEPMSFASLETPVAEEVKEAPVIPETPVYETQAPVMEVETPVSESTEDVSLDEDMPITSIAKELKEQLIKQAEISGDVLIAEATKMDLENKQQRERNNADYKTQLEFAADVAEKARMAQGTTAPLEQDAVSLTMTPDIAA